MTHYFILFYIFVLQIRTILSVEWFVDDWYLKGTNYSFSYPVLEVAVNDTLTFEWNVTVHGMNDVFIYPSLDCDNDTVKILVSYSSPAVYMFNESDKGKTLFFVNSVGMRCQFGVNLLVNVTENVLDDDDDDDVDLLDDDGHNNTDDTAFVIDFNDTTTADDDNATNINNSNSNNTNIAISIQSGDQETEETKKSSANTIHVSKNLMRYFLPAAAITLVSIFL
jgi:hypothetical protein